MEGACGKILSTEDPSVVIKKIHRRNRPQQRTSSLRAEKQAAMQMWAAQVCRSLGCKLLYVPRAWDVETHSYKMERISTDSPLLEDDIQSHPVLTELLAFYRRAREERIFPADYELYIQPDGRVAMVDFDKFALWLEDGNILYPWGLVLPCEQAQKILQRILGRTIQ